MQLVTGGAFNGKKQWVIKEYGLRERPHEWHSFYESGTLKEWSHDTVVLEGIERHVRRLLEEKESPEPARTVWQRQLAEWADWERRVQARRLILIGTDITKGVVPVNAFDRMWRDTAGWCFQDAARQAEEVIQIWYGLPERLKNKEEKE